MLVKIIGVGLCGVVVNLVLKQYRPEFCLLSNICTGLILFMMVVDGVKEIAENFIYLNNIAGIKSDILSPIFKVVGIGYITEFASDIAEESGNKSIAGKIILGGKITICVLALPIIKNLINAILSLI